MIFKSGPSKITKCFLWRLAIKCSLMTDAVLDMKFQHLVTNFFVQREHNSKTVRIVCQKMRFACTLDIHLFQCSKLSPVSTKGYHCLRLQWAQTIDLEWPLSLPLLQSLKWNPKLSNFIKFMLITLSSTYCSRAFLLSQQFLSSLSIFWYKTHL